MHMPEKPSRTSRPRLNRREPSLTTVLDNRARVRAQTIRNASRYGPPLAPALSVATRVHQPGIVVLTLSGEVDTCAAPLITLAVARELPGAPERVIIDLARVTLLTSVGISQLIGVQVEGTKFNFELVLVAPSDVVLHALNKSGTAERFVIHSAIDDALGI